MKVDELFREGYLKRIPRSEERVKKSLVVAERYLSEAKKALDAGIEGMVVLAAYSCVFHAARAILFRDGVGERSHFAVYDYLKEKHGGLGTQQIDSFNLYRQLRHSVAYGLDTEVGADDGRQAIKFAESFLGKVKDYLKLQPPHPN
ncbi:MAG: HEPN domain-containing protein [Candidatus Micrarchaeota archaeon]